MVTVNHSKELGVETPLRPVPPRHLQPLSAEREFFQRPPVAHTSNCLAPAGFQAATQGLWELITLKTGLALYLQPEPG